MTSVKKALGVAMATGAVAVLSAVPASAGLIPVQGSMQATPNPAMVGDTVTVANMPGGANTCVYQGHGGESDAGPALEEVGNPAVVLLEIVAPDSTNLPEVEVMPDQDGNWSYQMMADQVGTYMVDATCLGKKMMKAEPAATSPFRYNSLDIVVNQVPDTLEPTTTSMDTADTSGETTTTAAAAVAAAPRYTG